MIFLADKEIYVMGKMVGIDIQAIHRISPRVIRATVDDEDEVIFMITSDNKVRLLKKYIIDLEGIKITDCQCLGKERVKVCNMLLEKQKYNSYVELTVFDFDSEQYPYILERGIRHPEGEIKTEYGRFQLIS